MPSERVQRQIDRLLDEAEEAISSQDWAAVAERAQAALRLDPENADALSYLAAAERDPSSANAPPETADASRARLEQYIPRELLDKLEGARRSGAGSGERRVVTMLFCDVTGSTSAAETLDPEEWAEIMNGAFEHLISPVYRYEGTVARLMGDAILAFFGAPIAHEDDPQRAVLAGLDIVNGIRDYQAEVKARWNLDFGVRVGINTGLVVVGEVGSDLRVEYTAMGDAINLAARMEQTAPTGTVQISSDTHSLIAPLFEFDDPEEIEVKGKSEPVLAYRVLGEKADPGSLRGIEGLSTPLIGRDEETSQMRGVLERLNDGRGAIVSLIGEAGIGKSSLLNELHTQWEEIAGVGAPWVEGRGVSYDTTRPYGMFSQRMFQVMGVSDKDSIETVRSKVALAPVAFPSDVQSKVVNAISVLLALDTAEDGSQIQGEDAQRTLYDACHSWWRAAASHSPLVIVMDDLHWADPASVELMIDLFPLLEEVPLLLLCSFRPERQSPAWRVKQAAEADFPHLYTEISLSALSDDDSGRLFENLLGVAEFPTQLRQTILEKTEGNPFFLEEFIRTLIDTGAIARDESGMRWRAETDVQEITIPDNLLALLSSRIDRLEEEPRRTLQLSSVIGRSFYHGVLKLITEPSVTLDRQLNTLQWAELIREAARLPELEYTFQHDLTREAAYNSILLRERREFHLRVGEAVEQLFGDRLEENAHLLAHHFQQADDKERALKYSVLAADVAARLYANAEAITQYTRAIEIAKEVESSSEQLISLYLSRGRAQEISGRHDEALAGYQELADLGQETARADIELAALLPMVTIRSTIGGRPDSAIARALSERSLALAQQLGDHPSEARILWNNLLIEILAGEYQKALEFGERSLQIANQYGLEEQTAFARQDMARAQVALERFADARESLEGAQAYWRSSGNQVMLADNLYNSTGVFYARGQFGEGTRLTSEALEISRKIGSELLESIGLISIVHANTECGDLGEALAAVDQALEILAGSNDAGVVTAMVHATASAVYGLYGLADMALKHADLATDMADATYTDFFRTPMALAHVHNGQLHEAEVALQPMYRQPRFQSKRNMEYMGILTSLPDVVRGELVLAQEDYEQILEFEIEAQARDGGSGISVVLPDRLRARGVALFALGRAQEAWEALSEAREIGEAYGSKRALWRIYFEMSRVAAQEQRDEESRQHLEQSKDLINYIADNCGEPAIREAFLNTSQVRSVLETG